MMRTFYWALVFLSTTVSAYGQDQGTTVGIPAGSVQSYINEAGDIVYYSTGQPITPEDKFKQGFEDAVKSSKDIKQFIKENPEAIIVAGKGGVFYGITEEEIEKATFDATVFASDPQYGAGTVVEYVRNFLNPTLLLGNLAKNMIEDARRLTCDMSVKPKSVEGSASLGVVSFSASWELVELCGGG